MGVAKTLELGGSQAKARAGVALLPHAERGAGQAIGCVACKAIYSPPEREGESMNWQTQA